MTEKRRYWLANGTAGQNAFFEAALDPLLWEKGDGKDWDVCWRVGMPKPGLFKRLRPGQFVNHLPGNAALTVKSRLYETLAAHRDRLAGAPAERRMGFFPTVYDMPGEHVALQSAAMADPDALWMLKPKRLSRGRGIELLRDPGLAPLDDAFMVQSYLDRPHLFSGHKYVMRRYVAITSVEPLRAYLFAEGFIKLASEPYDDHALDNPFAYLTNPDINARNDTVETPVVFVSLEKYRAWLRDGGHDDARLFGEVEDMLALSVIAAREDLRRRGRLAGGDLSNCFELLGLDCMVDADLKPWLLECNLSPSLDICAEGTVGGDDEARAKEKMVRELVGMVGLNAPAPLPSDPTERARGELERAGGWSMIVPSPDPASAFEAFPNARLADYEQFKALKGVVAEPPAYQSADVSEIVVDDQIALYRETGGEVAALNETASLIWLRLTGGATADEAAHEIAAATGADLQTVRADVWDTAADWVRDGFLKPAAAKPACQNVLRTACAAQDVFVGIAGAVARIRFDRPEAGDALRALPPAEPLGSAPTIDVSADACGYLIREDDRPGRGGLRLAEVAPEIQSRLLKRAGDLGESLLLRGALARLDGNEAILLLSRKAGGWDELAHALPGTLGGVVVLGESAGVVAPEAWPLRVAADGDGRIFAWPDGATGRMIPCVGGAARRVRSIIQPHKLKSGRASFNALSGVEALSACAANLIEGTAPPGAGDLSRLSEWLRGVETLRLTFSTVEEATSALSETFAITEVDA
ncbi:MAG: PqqD family peptide modification chaperone [Pseudomonadota bacterium]